MFVNNKQKIAQLIIARLDGKDINRKFKYYESLVKKGIGGFIIFGGKLKQVKNGIKKLQKNAEVPLFIASDLEQGLGQQIEGGTLFPHFMAISQAVNLKNKNDVKLLRKAIGIIAKEAKAAGINLIFSPVLDVNTNPKNPIICTRAFSDNPRKVAWFGQEFIKGFQKHGLIACAKHFPGHGDTIKDSHLSLPVVKAGISRLQSVELYPFSKAIKAGVKMVMMGHLKVPAIDSRYASSLSKKTIQGLLKEEMKFKGLVITDAMNMHAVKELVASGDRSTSRRLGRREEKACLAALNAGADILLHPGKPEKIINYLNSQRDKVMPAVEKSFQRVIRAKKLQITEPAYSTSRRPTGRHRSPSKLPADRQNTDYRIGTKSHWKTAEELTQKSIRIKNKLKKFKKTPVILILDDDNSKSGGIFIKEIRKHHPKAKSVYVDNNYRGNVKTLLTSVSGKTLIATVFSKTSAWKGRSWLSGKLEDILKKTLKASEHSVIVSFCCPYMLSDINPVRKRRGFLANGAKADTVINAYSGSGLSEKAAAKILCNP